MFSDTAGLTDLRDKYLEQVANCLMSTHLSNNLKNAFKPKIKTHR